MHYKRWQSHGDPSVVKYSHTGHRTHGLSKTPEYKAWLNMKARCKYPIFTYHHGRGIRVYSGWEHDFESFYSHIGPRPDKEHTVDRIDNTRGYEPGNVRWATMSAQILNSGLRKSNTSGYRCVKKLGKKWRAVTTKNYKTYHLGMFNTPEEAAEAVIRWKKDHAENSR